jgi:hypothetical protein
MNSKENFEFNEEKVLKNLKSGKCSICGEIELNMCDKIFGVCDKCMQNICIPPVDGGCLYNTFKQFKKNAQSNKIKINKNDNESKKLNDEQVFDKKKSKIIIFENSNKNDIKNPVTSDDVLNITIALNTTPDVKEFINIV